jgi:hypothetical protein
MHADPRSGGSGAVGEAVGEVCGGFENGVMSRRIARRHRANLVVLDGPSYTFLPGRLGTNLVREVYVDGEVVVKS